MSDYGRDYRDDRPRSDSRGGGSSHQSDRDWRDADRSDHRGGGGDYYRGGARDDRGWREDRGGGGRDDWGGRDDRGSRDDRGGRSHRDRDYEDSREYAGDRGRSRDDGYGRGGGGGVGGGGGRGGRYHEEGGGGAVSSIPPSNKVIIRDVDPAIDDNTVFDAYAVFGSISVLRPSRDRQYFFVDYSSVQEATAAVAARHVFIGDCRTFVEFARPKASDGHAAPDHSSQHVVLDWRCALCNFVNFAKRGACKQCNSPRDPNAELVDPSAAKTDWSSLHVDEGSSPCDTLIVKGLDVHSDENSILAVLSRYSTGIRQVRIMRERGSNLSRGFCFVDFVSVDAATTMLKGCLAVEIDGRTVKMSYAKPKDSMNLVFGGKHADESLTMHARDVAQKAIADRLGRLGANLASLNAKGYGIASALSVPPGFVKDPNSAWYVNSATGMYYDVNSKSYLHAATGKYYYLDVATNSLKEWASAAAAAVAAAPSAAAAEADKFLLEISEKPESSADAAASTLADAAASTDPSTQPSATAAATAVPADVATNAPTVPAAVLPGAAAAPTVKPAFSLALKSKAPPKKAVDPAPAAADDGKPFVMALKAGPVKKEAKSNASNIALWNKKALELHEEEEVVVPTNAAMPKSGQPLKRSQFHFPLGSERIVMSAKGEVAVSAADLIKEPEGEMQPSETEKNVELPAGLQFVCFPCKRGFFSDEQMLAHEQKSLNHQAVLERLNIQQIKEEITSKASKAAMRDEVKKYRESLEQQKVVREDKIARSAGPADTLGADNVGNKLLQKMGWSEGKGLGKEETGSKAPINVVMREERAGLGSGTNVPITGDNVISASDSYADAVRKRARARYASE